MLYLTQPLLHHDKNNNNNNMAIDTPIVPTNNNTNNNNNRTNDIKNNDDAPDTQSTIIPITQPSAIQLPLEKYDHAANDSTEQINAKIREGWTEHEAKQLVEKQKTLHNQHDKSLTLHPTRDLYEEEKRSNLHKFRHYRYINPWIRFLLILPIVYLYSVSSAILTYRNNTWQNDVDAVLKDPATNPNSNRPLPNAEHWFILRDLFFDFLPAAGGSTYTAWKFFADFTPAFFNVLLLILLLIRRDIVRFAEYVVYQMILFAGNTIAHVVTTLPDAGGVQSSCYNPQYYTQGSWWAYTFTFVYCGDMLWSGHTSNTLLPIIMIRRLLWDLFGWHFTLKKQHHDNETKEQRGERLLKEMKLRETHRIQIARQIANSYDGKNDNYNRQFLQFIQQSSERAEIHTPYEQKPQFANNTVDNSEMKNNTITNTNNPLPNNDSMCDPAQSTLAIDHDPNLIGDADKHDVRITVPLPTDNLSIQDQQAIANNKDNDIYFHVKKSPYVTPVWVARHRKFWYTISMLARIGLPIWFTILCFSILIIRYHYTVDVFIAILMVLFVTSNTQLSQWLVRFIYRPYYHNYQYKQWWKPVYLTWPLNQEQINYEERVRRVALGGYL